MHPASGSGEFAAPPGRSFKFISKVSKMKKKVQISIIAVILIAAAAGGAAVYFYQQSQKSPLEKAAKNTADWTANALDKTKSAIK